MTGMVLQTLAGSLAFLVMVSLKMWDSMRLLPPAWRKPWLKRAIQVAMMFVASACLLEPLIPGTADLTIHAPAAIPGMLDTLAVETIPVGFLGEADGAARTSHDRFDERGIAQVTVRLGLLETGVRLRVYDRGSPNRSVVVESVYLSPFVRRRLVTKVVRF